MTDPRCRPEAFLFDLDGVLVDSHEVHLAAYARAFNEFGLALPDEAREWIRGGASRSQVLRRAGVPDPLREALSEAKHSAVLDHIVGGVLEPITGAEDILTELHDLGVPVALVSNSSLGTPWILAKRLDWAFAAIVDGDRLPVPKPAPDGFHLAARLLDVSITRCVVLEDSIAGLTAARESGAYVVQVGPGPLSDLADYRVDHLGQIPVAEWMRLADGPDPRF